MGNEKKVKKKCCHKYEKKGKHCKSCPELQQCVLPFDDYNNLKKKKEEKKKRAKELKKKKER